MTVRHVPFQAIQSCSQIVELSTEKKPHELELTASLMPS